MMILKYKLKQLARRLPKVYKGNLSLTGFTLIEIIVVLGIVSLILGIASVYLFSFKPAVELRLSSQEIVAALNQARSLAITNLDNYKVVFDVANEKYVIKDSLDADLDAERSLENSIDIESTNLDDDTAIFKPNGSLSSFGNKSIVLKNNIDERNTITIINSTGRIKIINN